MSPVWGSPHHDTPPRYLADVLLHAAAVVILGHPICKGEMGWGGGTGLGAGAESLGGRGTCGGLWHRRVLVPCGLLEPHRVLEPDGLLGL